MAPHAPEERAQLLSLIPKGSHKRFKGMCDRITSEFSYTTTQTKEDHRAALKSFLDKHPGALTAYNLYAPAFNASSTCRADLPIFPEDGGNETDPGDEENEVEPEHMENEFQETFPQEATQETFQQEAIQETFQQEAIQEASNPEYVEDAISREHPKTRTEPVFSEEFLDSEHAVKFIVNPTDFPLQRIRNLVSDARVDNPRGRLVAVSGMQAHFDFGYINYIRMQLKNGPVHQIDITDEEIMQLLGLSEEGDGKLRINWDNGRTHRYPSFILIEDDQKDVYGRPVGRIAFG
ncbi:hypothetical protein DM02DRAFT_651075 [Periconia macrospinosa]|uniref:Uncharacterized protein n=1 Tax=Periconia macrospinosa TaxID=97972 RepID=A0A2V1E3W9_9PLEO|nr:hypothetical protein DM02DRAFT_651075 [Periconia macrospinosa]